MKCLVYHRRSAAHQGDPGAELARLWRHALDRGWDVEGEWLDEQERPSSPRPAFEALCGELGERREPVVLLALSLSRLFPTRLPSALKRLAAWLEEPPVRVPVRLVTLEDGVDTAEDARWAGVASWLSLLASEQRREASAAGHALRARAGLVLRQVWDEPRLRRLYREGESQRQIARALATRDHRPSQSSVCLKLRELRAEGYLGEADEVARRRALEERPLPVGGRPRAFASQSPTDRKEST